MKKTTEDIKVVATNRKATHDFTIHEPSQSFGAGFITEGEPLADLDWSGLVINSDENDRHVVRRNLKTPELNQTGDSHREAGPRIAYRVRVQSLRRPSMLRGVRAS